MVGADRQSIGRRCEQLALRYLIARGLRVIRRNFRCRHGEIDLVMQDASDLVFVEVRYRRGGGLLSAATSVDSRKQRKLARAAAWFLASHSGYDDAAVRFDVIALEGRAPRDFKIQWLQDAFRPDGWRY